MIYEKEIIISSNISIISLLISSVFFIILPISSVFLVWNRHQWVTNLLITEVILALTFFFISKIFEKVAESFLKMLKEDIK